MGGVMIGNVGIPLLCAVLCLLAACILAGTGSGRRKRKGTYRNPVRRRQMHPQGFVQELTLAYEAGGSIRQMLYLAAQKYRDDPVGEELGEAIRYLRESRYKDYETALSYIEEDSEEYRVFVRELMEREMEKKRRLPMKEKNEETEERKKEK